MKILGVGDDVSSTITRIRLREPLQALCATTGWDLRFRQMSDCTRQDLAEADVLIVQRGCTRRAHKLMRQMRHSGGHTLYEIDDLLTAAAPHLLHFQGLKERTGSIVQCLAAAELVTVSTARLGSALRARARRIEVVPNFAPPRVPQAGAWRADEPVSLIFAASDRVCADFIAPAVLAVAAARPYRVRVVCIGPSAALFEGVSGVSGLQVTFVSLMPRETFWDFVASQVNPVAVIPLDDSAFSACKSAIKYFDYAAIGVPVLCSRLPPYADAVIDGRTGALVDNTQTAWTAALAAVVDDPVRAQAWAREARADVARRFNLEHTVAAWRNALSALGARSKAAAPHSRFSQVVQGMVIGLRSANRARLARRRTR